MGDNMDLDLRQLRYFIKVAEHLSFTEAANQLFVAQSAISQQIADLEDKIGARRLGQSDRPARSPRPDALTQDALT